MAVEHPAVARWAEAIAAIARTGLAFSESPYDRERYEELLLVAGDMMAESSGLAAPDEFVAAWQATSGGRGVSGYVTPKVGVGAIVGNEQGEILLIQRSDNHRWLYPTGWADVGYSAAEVCIKEVREETGIIVEPERIIAVLDGMQMGNPTPHYVLLFQCKAVGGALNPNAVECDAAGWFADGALPKPLMWGAQWADLAFAAIRGEKLDAVFDAPRDPVWRTLPG